jgi:hypothetical protein
MAFIGNTVQTQGFTPAIDYFNGNGVTVTFTLSRPVVSVAQMIVAVDNVIQNPNSAFTVAGNAITFSSAPLSGTNNIWVEYTSLITTYNAISQDPTVIGDIRATGGYLAEGDFGNSYVDGTIVDYVTGNARITTGPIDDMTFYHGGTASRSEMMKLSYAGNSYIVGNLGVGTTSPLGKVDASWGGRTAGQIPAILVGANSDSTTRSNTTQKMGVIGAAHYTNAQSPVGLISSNSYASNNDVYIGGGFAGSTAATSVSFWTAANSTTTQGTEAMRIDSSGNVVIKATTSQLGLLSADIGTVRFTDGTPSAFLNWRSNQATGRPCIQVQNLNVGNDAAFRTAAWDGTNSLYWTFGQNINSAQTNFDFCYASVAGAQTSGSSTCYVRFTNSGQVYNTSGTYGTISDIKLKENIVDATPKLNSLLQLKVRNFTLKADETKAKQLGFVAQEVQEVFPACVESFDDIDPDTKEKTGETLTVKTAILIPMLVKAIQEQQAMIEELKTKVAALEDK